MLASMCIAFLNVIVTTTMSLTPSSVSTHQNLLLEPSPRERVVFVRLNLLAEYRSVKQPRRFFLHKFLK